MIVHNLKIQYVYAKKVASGIKTFELRKDDRNFREGDYIAFEVIDCPQCMISQKEAEEIDETKEIMDNHLYKIDYKLKGCGFGLDDDYCILSIKPVPFVPVEKSTGIIIEEIK